MAKREKRASWFKMFLHQKALFDSVPDQTLGVAVKAAMAYFDTGTLPCLDPLEMAIFSSIRHYVDESLEDYKQDVENGKKGGRPKQKPPVTAAMGCIVPLTQADTEAEAEVDTEAKGVLQPADNPPSPTRFIPPTVNDVRSYCNDKAYSVDARRFVDYYASVGWRVGKNPMKDWKVALRNWQRKEKQNAGSESEPTWTVGIRL